MRYNWLILVSVLAITANVFAEEFKFSYDDYAHVLKKYVADNGTVNYKSLKNNRQKLESFINTISQLDSKTFGDWDDNQKTAFWLNVYNACTLKVIIDNYPIKSSFFKSRIYPKNSIRQIPGVWDKVTFKVMGNDFTLEYIEHKILRKDFNTPAIHMALVCAAIGCPPLRTEPYLGDKLNEQLADQSRKFLSNLDKFRIDQENNIVYMSPIFKWFAGDFKKRFGYDDKQAVLIFISKHIDKENADYILTGNFKVKYLKYDWTLNE